MKHTVALKQNHEFRLALQQGQKRRLPLFCRLLPQDQTAHQ